jgi:predicted MFS family arabinose efflux permease
LFGAYLLVPEFAQAQPAPSAQPSATYGLGVSAAAVGFLLLPLGIAQMLAGPAAGWLVRRVPVESVCAAGRVVMAGALVGLAAVRTNALALAGAVAALGVGAGLALQTSSDAATQDVDRQIAASSSAVNSTVRRLAGGTGGQIGILVLATVTQPGGSAPRILAFTLVYWIAAGLCLGGAIACSIRRR